MRSIQENEPRSTKRGLFLGFLCERCLVEHPELMRNSDRPLRIDQFRHVLSHKRRRVDHLVPSFSDDIVDDGRCGDHPFAESVAWVIMISTRCWFLGDGVGQDPLGYDPGPVVRSRCLYELCQECTWENEPGIEALPDRCGQYRSIGIVGNLLLK